MNQQEIEQLIKTNFKSDEIVRLSEDQKNQEIQNCIKAFNINHEKDFEIGFKAGIAWACRKMINTPCFCGCHISETD